MRSYGVMRVFIGVLFLVGAPLSASAATNLITNPSAETANAGGTAPVNWQTDIWGGNTVSFQYKTDGHSSNRSVYVNMTKRVSGDAKWYFDPVAVSPNTDYTFTEWYKSNVPTHIVWMSLDAAGNATYNDVVVTVAASATNWTQVTGTIHTPANAAKLSVLHVIERVGWLQTDDMSLSTGAVTPPPPPPTFSFLMSNGGSKSLVQGQSVSNSISATLLSGTAQSITFAATGLPAGASASFAPSACVPACSTTVTIQTLATTPTGTYSVSINGTSGSANASTVFSLTVNASTVTPPPPPTPELVPNNSVETVKSGDTTSPANWQKSSWGTNTPKYEYLATGGHDGSRSVKLTMTGYTDGDAKWLFDPVVLPTGKSYRFTAWYKTNTIPHVVAMYTKADGSEDFFGLPDPQPNGGTGWQQYSDVFPVPAGTQSVSVFFFLTNNGYVETDDYHVAPYAYTPFTRGMVSLSFDDGFEENVTSVLPVLNAYGFKITQCSATQYVEGITAQENIIKQVSNAGHEICSHTVTHPFMSQIALAGLTTELTHSQQFLKALTGQAVTGFSSPYGDYTAAVNNEIKKYYAYHRTTDEGFNSKDTLNPYRLKVQNMTPTTSLSQFQAWVNQAKTDKTWLILIYHVVKASGTPDLYDTKKADFDAQMQWLASAGVTIKPMRDALTEAQGQ